MLFKKLVDLCRKKNTIELWQGSDTAWLSNGEVYAKLGENTDFDFADIICIMEITDEKAETINKLSQNFSKEDLYVFNPRAAEAIKPVRYSINCDGLSLQPFVTSKGIIFLSTKNMSIFRDIGCKTYYLSEFRGLYIILVAVDNTTIGMIRPHCTDLETMHTFSNEFAHLVTEAYQNNFCDSGEHQYSLLDT